jgi:hypothetical protein
MPTTASQEGGVPVSVTFEGDSFGTALATGHIGKTAGACRMAVEHVEGPASDWLKGISRVLLVQYDWSSCKMQLAVYEQPPEGNGICGHTCKTGHVSDDEIRATWSLIAGPVTVG